MSTGRVGVSRLVRVGDGTGVGVVPSPVSPYAGRLGVSRMLRVWGTTLPSSCLCIDLFDRTVASGWGSGDWRLPAWEAGSGNPGNYAAAASVDGAIGRIDLSVIDGYSGTSAKVAITGEYPGTIEIRHRGAPWQAFISPSALETTTGAVEFWAGYTHGYGQGPFFAPSFEDHRSPVGTEASDWDTWYIDMTLPGDMTAWWTTRIRIDEYGTYMSMWRDGESRNAHDAATQPTGFFGDDCPQGGGETWTVWDACSDQIGDPGLSTFQIQSYGRFFNVEDGVPETGAPTLLEFDYIGLCGGFCHSPWSFAAGFNETICWPSLPDWGLGDEHVLHGDFLPEHHGVPDGLWVISGTPPGTADAWCPTNDDTTFELVIQETGYYDIIVWAWLTDSGGYSLTGACSFTMLRNGLAVATDSFTETSGSLRVDDIYCVAGDTFIVVYQTEVGCPGGGQQGLQVQVDYLGPTLPA